MEKEIRTERPNLFEPCDSIVFLVQLGGAVQPCALLGPVRAVFAAHESTLCRIELCADGRAFYRRQVQSGCTVQLAQGDWQDLLRRQERRPFDLQNGELMRVFALASPQGQAQLLVMAHHLAGDGKAIAGFIEDVLHALAGTPPAFCPLWVLTEQTMPKHTGMPAITAWYADGCNRHWQRGGTVFHWEDLEQQQRTYWQGHASEVLCARFTPAQTRAVCAAAKALGVSVNSYLAAAFLKALPGSQRLGLAVGVRAPGDRTLNNQVGAVMVRHRYTTGKSFGENAQKLHRRLAKRLQSPATVYFVLRFLLRLCPVLWDAVLLHTTGLLRDPFITRLARQMGYEGPQKRTLGITNLTVLPIQTDYGTFGVEQLTFVPPAVSYAQRVIGVVTVQGELCITYRLMQKNAFERRFFKQGIANIFQAAGL